jgi:hypothetical protein
LEIVVRIDDFDLKFNALPNIAQALNQISDSQNTLKLTKKCKKLFPNLEITDSNGQLKSQIRELQKLRENFSVSSFDIHNAYESVCSLYCTYLRTGNFKMFENIIRHCPQLELDFILPENSLTIQYDKIEQWIEMINDEVDQENNYIPEQVRLKKTKWQKKKWWKKCVKW